MLRARRGSPEKKSVSPRYGLSAKEACGFGEGINTHVFEILKEIGNGLPLAIGEDRLVQAIAGFGCDIIRLRIQVTT